MDFRFALFVGTTTGAVETILLLGVIGGGCAMLYLAALTELVQAGGEETGVSCAWLDAVPLSRCSLTVAENIWGLAFASAFVLSGKRGSARCAIDVSCWSVHSRIP